MIFSAVFAIFVGENLIRNFNIMKSFAIILFALAVSAPAATVDLFNGKNLDGWVSFADGLADASSVFSVQNGVIRVQGKPFGFIRTDKKYSNFRLHVEWKYPRESINSGIFLFVQDDMKLWPNAVECQLMKGKVGDFVLLGGSNVAEFKLPAGAERPKFPVVKRFGESNENPAGEWNNADIICKDGSITVFINGTLQNKATGSLNKSGYIALQSEGGEIHFRNVRLTPLED